MSAAIKISLIASGIFLLTGLLSGVLKYRRIMTSPRHRAPVYVDKIAHRASLLYSFAALVIARLLDLNLPNFILMPRVAWASNEAAQTLADQLIMNIEAFVAGQPQNLVN